MKTWWSNANTHKLTLGARVISIQLCPFHLVVHPSHTFVLQSAEAIQILQAIATRHCSGQHRWCWATALEATADSQWNIKINQKVLSPTRYMLVFVALWAHKNLRAKFNMAVLKATSAAPCLPWYMVHQRNLRTRSHQHHTQAIIDAVMLTKSAVNFVIA